MKIRRFIGASTSDAMRQLKAEMGEDALILTNRKTEQGIEILATLDPKFDQLTRKSSASSLVVTSPVIASPVFTATVVNKKPELTAPLTHQQAPLSAASNKPAMSTVSFQDYVRDRLSQAQQEGAPPTQMLPSFNGLGAPQSTERDQAHPNFAFDAVDSSTQAPLIRKDSELVLSEHAVGDASLGLSTEPQLLSELREVKAMLQRQVDSATWLSGGSALSARSRHSHQLLDAGLSPGLIRYLMEHMPDMLEPHQERAWLEQILKKNCRPSNLIPELIQNGGVVALMGPTGVGKTTTIAKLAARAVLHQGAEAVALVTLDSFRVGAYEQLATYGRLLGVPVLQVRDRAGLHSTLSGLQVKRTVLIDTIGVSTRDDKLSDLLSALDLPIIQKVFVISAATQGDAIDRALKAFQVAKGSQTILTKLDEVERLGSAVDCIVRHSLLIAGLTNGQRVPEDWHPADPLYLARQALRWPGESPWQSERTVAALGHQTTQSIGDPQNIANLQSMGKQMHV